MIVRILRGIHNLILLPRNQHKSMEKAASYSSSADEKHEERPTIEDRGAQAPVLLNQARVGR